LGKSTISYTFFKQEQYSKRVHFFLMRVVGGSVLNHDAEVETVEWFPFSAALPRLAYENERNVLQEAKKLFDKERTDTLS
jgi:hypothetical protein